MIAIVKLTKFHLKIQLNVKCLHVLLFPITQNQFHPPSQAIMVKMFEEI